MTTHHPPHPPPVLLSKLRIALSCLYDGSNNNSSITHNNGVSSVKEAHDFLLRFKSSNIRRAISSKLRSRKDRSANNATNNNSNSNYNNNGQEEDDEIFENDNVVIGSIFLACISLLLAPDVTDHERIFAAQTLNHRCRSLKIIEAFDIESEDGIINGIQRLVEAWEMIRNERSNVILHNSSDDTTQQHGSKRRSELREQSDLILNSWLGRYLPMLAHSVNSSHDSTSYLDDGAYGASLLATIVERRTSSLLTISTHERSEGGEDYDDDDDDDDEGREEKIKGILMMDVLAVCLYISSIAIVQEEDKEGKIIQTTSWANAVHSELSSALSIVALRLRYRPTKLNIDDGTNYAAVSSVTCPILIDMLLNTVLYIAECAETNIYYSRTTVVQHANATIDVDTIKRIHCHAISNSISSCLTALPETVLLAPTGSSLTRSTPSVDRAALRAASYELRSVDTGMNRVWEIIQHHFINKKEVERDDLTIRLLSCFETWARFVAVPISIVDMSIRSIAIPYLHHNDLDIDNTSVFSNHLRRHRQKTREVAYQYLITIFESASPSLTTDDILAASLGVNGGGSVSQHYNKKKKKQGSKSKRRQEEKLGRNVTIIQPDGGRSMYEAELQLYARRNAACIAAAIVFGISLTDGLAAVSDDWGLRPTASTSSNSILSQYEHGMCAASASAAASVLPHLLSLERGNASSTMIFDGERDRRWRIELFSAIAVTTLRRMCGSLIREIRVLAYEPLMLLSSSLSVAVTVSSNMEQIAIGAICDCVLSLATSCGYPPTYFDHLSANNDAEIEIERNDVRDVARTVCSLDKNDCIIDTSPSILILECLIGACSTAIYDSVSIDHPPPETAVHILSALAKPLNKLGRTYNEQKLNRGCSLITISMQALANVCNQLNSSFSSRSISQILPLSRLACMAIASLSPMLSSLAELIRIPPTSIAEKEMLDAFILSTRCFLQHAMLSTATIPELMAESTLKATRYDIIGAMRGSGGEDHVGCIALLRLSHESDHLVAAILDVYGSAIFHDLSDLHHGLKNSELQRGVNVDYGTGVCPVSRRIVLKVISRLAMHQMKTTKDDVSEGRAILHNLALAPLNEMKSLKVSLLTPDKLFRLCEASYDCAFFSPEVVGDILNNPSDLDLVFDCVVEGYSRLTFSSDVDALCHQWGRLRAGSYSLLLTSVKHSLSDHSANIISNLIRAECEAALVQCNQGPDSGSSLFNDHVVGEDMAHAGLYIILIRDCLNRIANNKGRLETNLIECQRCLKCLQLCAPLVKQLLLHPSPEASNHVDPRPTIAEAWYLTSCSLVSVCRSHDMFAACLIDNGVDKFFGESLALLMALIFLKDLGTKKDPKRSIQLGVSFDGPHTLAIQSFISDSVLLAPSILSDSSVLLIIPLDQLNDTNFVSGSAILIAALLRSFSGALPPWTVEEAPELIQSLYIATGSDANAFAQILSLSARLKASTSFGGVRSGELLGGKYLDASDSHIESFVSQSKEVCIKGNWQKMKVIIKATCGGKKKDSEFALRPSFTTWECNRL